MIAKPPRKTPRRRTTTIKERKARGEQFRRRRINLMGKGAALSKMCGAKIYILVERNDRQWDFSSESSPEWPPDQAILREREKRPERTGPEHYERNTKATPKKLPTTKWHRTNQRTALRLQSPPLLEVPQQVDWKSKLQMMSELACS